MKRDDKLVLTGRSGCRVEIIKDKAYPFVRKTSLDESYHSRLAKQADKQRSFVSTPIFKSPKVISEAITFTDFFDMDYIPGEKYSDFLIRISKNDLDSYIGYFINYLDNSLKKSVLTKIESAVFREKALSVQTKLLETRKLSSFIRMVIDSLLNQIPDSKIPIGYCHGDFTFSNMIFYNNSIFLVDFLDSFINTPLIDLVKLRQDTCFKWTLLIDNDTEKYKRDKTWQIMNYIDFEITNHFCEHSFYKDWYTYLQKFNLIRIIPYLSNNNEIQLIEKSLKTL